MRGSIQNSDKGRAKARAISSIIQDLITNKETMFTKKVNYFTTEKVTGSLSMSDAQAISNLCNQRSEAIKREVNNYNVCSKVVRMNTMTGASGNEVDFVKQLPVILIRDRVKTLMVELGEYAGLQGFLMEHIKLKDAWLEEINKQLLTSPKDTQEILDLVAEQQLLTNKRANLNGKVKLKHVDSAEFVDQENRTNVMLYLLNEAKASKIGEFIHKGGKLDTMRKNLANLPGYEYEELPDGRSALVTITPNYLNGELDKLHEELADLHRVDERRVNGFKAKKKTFETERTAKYNEDYAVEYDGNLEAARQLWNEIVLIENKVNSLRNGLKAQWLEDLKKEKLEVSSYKITIPEQLKPIINKLNPSAKDSKQVAN